MEAGTLPKNLGQNLGQTEKQADIQGQMLSFVPQLKMLTATKETKPVMNSTQARLLRKYKQASIV